MRTILLIVLALASGLSPLTSKANEHSSNTEDCVILLHGLGRSGASMLAVEWHLSRKGYTVENITYPSLQHPIEQLSKLAISEGLTKCATKNATTVHLVTHSLGGILLRHYLSEHAIPNLGRVVMLGPPNQGSQLADQIQASAVIKFLQPPAALQLGTGHNSVPKKLDAVSFDLGIIAGSKNYRPFIAQDINEPNDGTVSIEETKVKGMNDFIVLPVTHTFMMWDANALNQVFSFINTGSFQ